MRIIHYLRSKIRVISCIAIPLFTSLLTPYMLFAQEGCIYSISGKATELKNAKGLDGAIITLSGSNKSVISDKQSNFKFGNLCSGTYKLLIQQLGYKDSILSVKVEKDVNLPVVKLTHTATQLKEVEVIHNNFSCTCIVFKKLFLS